MQFIVITEQLLYTLWALFLGIFFGALYDGIRIVRMLAGISPVGKESRMLWGFLPVRRFGRGRRSRFAEAFFVWFPDLLYGTVCGAAFCIFLYASNNGRFRWYLLLGCAVGFFAYYFSVGRLVMCVSGYIVAAIRQVFGFLLFLLTEPFVWLGRGMRRLMSPLLRRWRRKKDIRWTERQKKRFSELVWFEISP